MSSDPFQVRFHAKLGVVIYDPLAQLSIPAETARLFKISTLSATTFKREIVFKDLAPCGDEHLRAHRSVINTYRAARREGKKAYCEGCRRHFGSVDFALCTECSELRCTCGTCGCATAKRRKAA